MHWIMKRHAKCIYDRQYDRNVSVFVRKQVVVHSVLKDYSDSLKYDEVMKVFLLL